VVSPQVPLASSTIPGAQLAFWSNWSSVGNYCLRQDFVQPTCCKTFSKMCCLLMLLMLLIFYLTVRPHGVNRRPLRVPLTRVHDCQLTDFSGSKTRSGWKTLHPPTCDV